MNKSRQLIFQVFGTHNFINYARTNADIIREYALLLQILPSFGKAPVLLFNAGAIATGNLVVLRKS
ncbi:MAG: hypothetical protein V7K94_31580 [Nostoc sp.]|uniref:hypothetical protein n=1 Tax=Nostoc sp. TaxID=1180 RepID=UPI002FF7780E